MDDQNQFAATQAPADEGFSFGKRINGQPVVPGMGAASEYTPPAPPAAPTHSFNPAPQPAAEEPPTFAHEPAPAPEPEPAFAPVAEAAPEPEPEYAPEPEQPAQESGYVPPSFSQAFQQASPTEPAPEPPQAEPIADIPAEPAPEAAAEAEAPAAPAFSEAFGAPAEPAAEPAAEAEAEASAITAEQAWENIPDNAKEAAGLDPATEFEQLPEAVREGLEEGISAPEAAAAPYEPEAADQPQPAAEETAPVADERIHAIQNALEVLNSPAADELSTRTRVQVEELKVLLEKGLNGTPEDVDRLKADGLDVIEKVADGIGSKNGLSTPFVNATSQLFRTEAVSPIDEHRRSQTIFAAREAAANQVAAESGAFDLQQKQAQASHQQKLAEQRESQPTPGQYL